MFFPVSQKFLQADIRQRVFSQLLHDAERNGANIGTHQTGIQDVLRAADFDQTRIFDKIYSTEFGMPGGQPYGVMIIDHQIRNRPSADHPVDDISVIGRNTQGVRLIRIGGDDKLVGVAAVEDDDSDDGEGDAE